jgi:NTE family protein
MFWDDVARRAFGLGGGAGGPVAEGQKPELKPAVAKPKIGLALGGGAARGWAHIGAIRKLLAAGIVPDVITGTSIGALVGGCLAAGKLDEVEEFARSLTKRRVLGLLDIHIGGSGLIGGDRLRQLLHTQLEGIRIEDLTTRFAAIATEYGTGHEIWLSSGHIIDAMRASYALPGVFNPVRLGGRWLMDGALVNPIPVTTARALGADIVICVNLNTDIKSRGTTIQSHAHNDDVVEENTAIKDRPLPMMEAAQALRGFVGRANGAPGMAAVMIDSFNITQDRISRSRLAGDPPDLMITPRLGGIGLFEFHRAAEAIKLGEEAAEKNLSDLAELIAAAP